MTSSSESGSAGSEGEFDGYRLSRAAERERIMLDPDNLAESYIFLYTEDYLANDEVWNRRRYPIHVPEKETASPKTGAAMAGGASRAGAATEGGAKVTAEDTAAGKQPTDGGTGA